MRRSGLAAVGLLVIAQIAAAQVTPNNAAAAPSSARREALRAVIAERAQASARAARVFVDRSKSDEERAAAVRGIDAFVNADDVAGATRVFLDTHESPEIRTLALSRIEHAVDESPALVTGVLQLAGTPTTPRPLRSEAVRVLAALSFSSLTMRDRSAELLPTLRALTRDPDPELRLIAFGILAANADDFAQQRLIECLRSAEAPPLPRQDCARLLGLRLHGDALPVLHQVLLRPPDDATRVEAIRLLGGYAESRPKLLELLRDASQSDTVRLAVLGTLYANDPEGFPAIALPVVQDESASDLLRLYGIQAVRLRRRMVMERQKSAAIPQFDAAIVELARTSKSAAVRQSAEEYLRAAGLAN